MTLDQAKRILVEPKYVRALLAASVESMARETLNTPLLNPTGTDRRITPEDIIYRQGVVAGLRIADSFFVEAMKAVSDERAEEAAEEQEKRDAVLPPAMVAALTTVRGGDSGSHAGS